MKQRFDMAHGFLTCLEKGKQAELYMERSPAKDGLYRGILWGKNGQLDLGILMPEKNRLTLKRSIPIEKLRQKGCWPVLGGKTVLRFAFGQEIFHDGWKPCQNPAALFPRDLLLQQSISPCLMKKTAAEFSLAMLWDPKKPFPLPPLFCFAHVEQLRGQTYLCFFFRSDGSPLPDGKICVKMSSN